MNNDQYKSLTDILFEIEANLTTHNKTGCGDHHEDIKKKKESSADNLVDAHNRFLKTVGHSGLCQEKPVSDAWLKIIEGIKEMGDVSLAFTTGKKTVYGSVIQSNTVLGQSIIAKTNEYALELLGQDDHFFEDGEEISLEQMEGLNIYVPHYCELDEKTKR